MSNKYLIVKGVAGLGNRLITLTSAIEYALRNNRKLVVDWTDGQFAPFGVNAFYECFEFVDLDIEFPLNDLAGWKSFYPSFWKDEWKEAAHQHFCIRSSYFANKIPARLVPSGRFRKLIAYWDKMPPKPTNEGAPGIWESVRAIFGNHTVVQGYHLGNRMWQDLVCFLDYCPPINEDVFRKHIRFKGSFVEPLNKFCSDHNLTENAIGIHVRCTDKQPENEIDILISYLKEKKSNMTVFLATDNSEVQDIFTNSLKNVITWPKFIPENLDVGLHQWAMYNNEQDVLLNMFKDSAADMYLLSKCSELLFQGNSTFSRISHIVRNGVQSIDWQTI